MCRTAARDLLKLKVQERHIVGSEKVPGVADTHSGIRPRFHTDFIYIYSQHVMIPAVWSPTLVLIEHVLLVPACVKPPAPAQIMLTH